MCEKDGVPRIRQGERERYLAEHPELAPQAATQPVATVPETTPETTVAEAA